MFKCPERELSSGDPSSPAHVQVMVPHVPHYLQLTLAICRAQTRCMMGHLTTLILSTYPQTPQLSVSLCGVWDILRTEMSLTCYTVFWVVCGNKYFITRQTSDNFETEAGVGQEAVDQRQSVILLDQSEPRNGFQWEVLEEVSRGGGCQRQGQEPGTSWYQLEQWACADSDDDQQPVTKGHDIELNSIGTCGLNRTKMNCVL